MSAPPINRKRWPRVARPLVAALLWLALIPFPPALSAAISWQPIGPNDQDVLAIAAGVSQPLVLYASTRTGGGFRSQNGGTTWKGFGAGLPQGTPIDWLGIDPRQPSLVLALAGGTPYRSSDGGRSWHWVGASLPAGVELNTGLVLADRTHTMLIGGTLGIYRSTDSGQHWHWSGNGLLVSGGVLFITASPRLPRRLLLGIAYRYTHGGRIYRSDDGGNSWHETDHNFPTTTIPWTGAWSATSPSKAWVAAGTIYRTDDAGAHWQADGFGLPFRPFSQTLARGPDGTIFLAAAGNLYQRGPFDTAWTVVATPWPDTTQIHKLIPTTRGLLAATSSGLFTADSDTLNWRDLGNQLPGKANVYALSGEYDQPMLFAGGDNTVWSRIPGESWQATGPGLPVSVGIRALLVLPGPPIRLLCATDYGVYFNSTTIDRWTMLPGPLAGRAVSALSYAPATAMVYAALADGGIYAAPESSLHWRLLPTSTERGTAYPLLVDRTGTWLLAGKWRSGDRGHSWQRTGISDPLNWLQSPEAGNVVLAGTAAHGLLRSTNYGINWQPVRAGIAPDANVAALTERSTAASNTLFAVADNVLYNSTDHGVHWRRTAVLPATALVTSMLPMPGDPAMLVAGTVGGGVLALHLALPASATPSATARALATRTMSETPTASPTSGISGTGGSGNANQTATASATPAASSTAFRLGHQG